MAPILKTYYRSKAFIFNVKGTLIDTSRFVERSWQHFATENGLDSDKIKLSHECLQSNEFNVLPGISTLLQKIPYGKWAICTTDDRLVVKKVLKQCGLMVPDIIYGGDEHYNYLDTISALGFKPEEVIVFQNDPAGIKAAHQAGAKVIACSTTWPVEELKLAGADTVVDLFTEVDFTILSDSSFEVEVKNTL